MLLSPKNIREDLRNLFRGSLQFDEATRRMFATDASLFRVLPLGVATPLDQEDLLTLVKYANEKKLGLTPRGGGTGLAGESLTSELVVDLTQHFQQILNVGTETVRVQPGVVASKLNQTLLPTARRLAIDSASEASCTIGGMLATNASGSRVMKYGYLRQYVESIQAIIGTGQSVTMSPQTHLPRLPITAESQLAQVLHQLIDKNRDLIQTCLPKTPFHRAGYLLHDLERDKLIQLQKVMIGSEGTLGFITEATLRTVPLPVERAVLLLGFTSMQQATEAVPYLMESGPAAIEMLDRRLITMACEADPVFKRWLSPSMQSALLIEWEGMENGTVLPMIEKGTTLLRQQAHPIVERLALEPEEAQHLWSFRSLALPALYANARRMPVAFLEDIGVPTEALTVFLDHVQKLLPRHETTASILCHAGAGIVHIRPLYDLHDSADIDRLKSFTQDVYAEVFRVGGTISAQHGVGLARTPWMAQQVGPLMELFRQVKTLFDPTGIYNRGKILGGSESPFEVLRTLAAQTSNTSKEEATVPRKDGAFALPIIEWEMHWAEQSPLASAEACHGCGACRTTVSETRMCPTYHAQTTEAASPRAKANLLRDMLQHPDKSLTLGSEELREVADLCVNCKMCAIECPSRVAIPQLMLEAKAQFAREQGLRWRDWTVSHIDTWARWGSRVAWLVNRLLRNRATRWVIEICFGITRHRRLPALHSDVFAKRAKRFGWTEKPVATDRPRVLYFADTYAQYFDPDLAEATVRVLQLANVQVYVPPEALQSGAASLSVGHVERAKRLAKRNINTLEPLTREGFTILCSEPTTALMFKQDYLALVDDPGAAQIARHTVELMSYLSQLQEQGRLPATPSNSPAITLGHHVPCHVKALQQGIFGPDLLTSAASYRIKTIDVSCSGMAGVYGLQQANYQSSLKAGKPMLSRFAQDDLHFGSSECSSCRLQMEHAGNKTVMHPVQWLALAYGVMPQLHERLKQGNPH